MTHTRLLTLALLTISYGASASTVDINLSENSVQASIEMASPWENSQQQVSFIYSDDAHRGKSGKQVSYGLYTGGTRGEISGRLGGKLLYSDTSSQAGTALALGGDLRIQIAGNMSARVMASVAPSVLTFSDMDRYSEFGAHLLFDIIPNTHVYFGFKSTQAEFDKLDEADLQKGWNLGFEMTL